MLPLLTIMIFKSFSVSDNNLPACKTFAASNLQHVNSIGKIIGFDGCAIVFQFFVENQST